MLQIKISYFLNKLDLNTFITAEINSSAGNVYVKNILMVYDKDELLENFSLKKNPDRGIEINFKELLNLDFIDRIVNKSVNKDSTSIKNTQSIHFLQF